MKFRNRAVFFALSVCLFLCLGLWAEASHACDLSLQAFPDDCQIQDRYREVRGRLQVIGVSPEEITEYRALRFIDRHSWEKAKSKLRPLVPWQVYDPKPSTWLIWERGENFSRAQFSGAPFSLEFVRALHRHAITSALMTDASVYLKGGAPGKIRSSFWQLPPGSDITCESKEVDEATAKLLLNYDLRTPSGQPLLSVNLIPCANLATQRGKAGPVYRYPGSPYYTGFLAYLPSSDVPDEIQRWSDVSASLWHDLGTGKSRALSPLELVADTQRWFVSIHPFGDGNGRTSRFIQDRLLAELDLPYPASGDLQQDLYTPKMKYREAMRKAEYRALEILETCAVKLTAHIVAPECQPVFRETDPAANADAAAAKKAFQAELDQVLAKAIE